MNRFAPCVSPELYHLVRKLLIQEFAELVARKFASIHLHYMHLAGLPVTDVGFVNLPELFSDLT